jgi:hypothetical protein
LHREFTNAGAPRESVLFSKYRKVVEIVVETLTDDVKARVMILLIKITDVPNIIDALSAPRRPENDENDLAAIGFPVDFRTVVVDALEDHFVSDKVDETSLRF